jgi:hypothetical protein
MKIMKLLAALVVVMAVFAVARPAAAEHSFAAEFDSNTRVDIQGVITRAEWTNPNAFFYVDVKDAVTGKVQNWVVEANCASLLAQKGWTRNTLQVGMVVSVPNAMRARDGSRKVNSRTIQVQGQPALSF